MERERTVRDLEQFQLRSGLCWIVRKESVPLLCVESAAAGQPGTSGELRTAGNTGGFASNACGLCDAGCRCIGMRDHKYLEQCLPPGSNRRRIADRVAGASV